MAIPLIPVAIAAVLFAFGMKGDKAGKGADDPKPEKKPGGLAGLGNVIADAAADPPVKGKPPPDWAVEFGMDALRGEGFFDPDNIGQFADFGGGTGESSGNGSPFPWAT